MPSVLHKRSISSSGAGPSSSMPGFDLDGEELTRTAAVVMASVEGSDDGSESDEDNVALLGLDGRSRGRDLSPKEEAGTWSQIKDIVVETVPTLLFTTIGLLFTGELLDHVSHWTAMKRIDELIIIIPVILNLKGNLEMNLSSRLGTAANVGDLDDRNSRRSILFGNMALLQVQATLVSFIAACLSFVLGMLTPRAGLPEEHSQPLLLHIRGHPHPHPQVPHDPQKPKSGLAEFIMVATTGITSACLSSLILGSFMCTLVVLCRRYNLNPDNIAPPIAACLGDLITLCLLGLTSTLLINFVNTPLPLIICILLAISSCACAFFVSNNNHVRTLIRQGWTPLFGAMFISSATGIILDLFVSRYNGFALLAVIISGLPGAVGSVAVSRISTTLHAAALSLLPTNSHKPNEPPHPSLRLVMITLFIITIPIEIVFLTILRSVGWLQLPIIFIVISIFFFCVAVSASLVFAQLLTEFLWKRNYDPDMYAMPLHSSVVDLIGQLLLIVCFEIVSLMGQAVEAKRENPS